jgi:hypothetical protein
MNQNKFILFLDPVLGKKLLDTRIRIYLHLKSEPIFAGKSGTLTAFKGLKVVIFGPHFIAQMVEVKY